MEKNRTLILASSSPRRRDLLREAGIVPDAIMTPACDETSLPGEKPRALAMRLARDKALAIAAKESDALILAADTVVACGRRILPKARDAADVAAFLRLLSGRRHKVFTGVALIAPGKPLSVRCSASVVQFRRLLPDEIARYAASGEGVGKAGGYAVQGQAGLFVKFISGSYSGIVGLPLFDVAGLLRSAGVSV